MNRFFFLFLLLINSVFISSFAQSTGKNNTKSAYSQVIDDRAEKIVAVLGISDSLKFNRVKKIIVNQYYNLNDIYTSRDEEIKVAQTQLNSDKAGLEESIGKIQQQTDCKISCLHPKFLSTLATELTTKQIDQIKDGMTYNVVHVTYNGYNQMILNLTAKQKKQIMDWLIEAREHAMNAESSEKKHTWFGKYKGRINNYLSAAGYDLKKAGDEWTKRRNAAARIK